MASTFASRALRAAVLILGFSLSASGAGYIKFDGLDGESKAAGHQGESDVLTWSWSVVRGESGVTGSTRQRGVAKAGDLVVTKVVDRASVKLLEACLIGKIFSTVKLQLEEPFGSGGQVIYLVVELSGVAVSSFSVGGSDEVDRPTETVSLNFDEVKVTYSLYLPDGSPGGNVETTWDFLANTP